MNSESLAQLSKEELVERILSQKALIQEMGERLARANAQLEAGEIELEIDSPIELFVDLVGDDWTEVTVESLSLPMDEQARVTRDALRHLNDIGYLVGSPLAECIRRVYGVEPTGWGVQQALYRGIKCLVLLPIRGANGSKRCRLRHQILKQTYVEGKRPGEVAEQLTISQRQYYRELKAGVQVVSEYILEPLKHSQQK